MNIIEKQIAKTKEQIKHDKRLIEAGWEEADEHLKRNQESLKMWQKELIILKLKGF